MLSLLIICVIVTGCTKEEDTFEHYDLKDKDLNTYIYHSDERGKEIYVLADLTPSTYESCLTGLFYKVAENDYILLETLEFNQRESYKKNNVYQFYNDKLYGVGNGISPMVFEIKLNGKKSKIKMPISSIEHIINFIEDLRNSNLLYDNKNIQIDFNGGETLLNKQFIFSFIKLTQNHGYRYSLTTNGTLIDQEIIDLINKYKINIQVSLDGNKESHDLNRKFNNSEGSFDIVLLKLKEIQSKCPNIKLTTVCVVTPETVKNFAENVKFLFFNGFYDIGTTVCSDYIWSENDYLEYKKQLKILGDFYIKCIEENNYFSFNVFRNKIENTLRGFSKGKCDAIKGQLAILPDGNILPCGVFIGCKNEEDFYIDGRPYGLGRCIGSGTTSRVSTPTI